MQKKWKPKGVLCVDTMALLELVTKSQEQDEYSIQILEIQTAIQLRQNVTARTLVVLTSQRQGSNGAVQFCMFMRLAEITFAFFTTYQSDRLSCCAKCRDCASESTNDGGCLWQQ